MNSGRNSAVVIDNQMQRLTRTKLGVKGPKYKLISGNSGERGELRLYHTMLFTT